MATLEDLDKPTETSLSVITPPVVRPLSAFLSRVMAFDVVVLKVTLAALKMVKTLGIPAVWIQPGAADEAVAEYVASNLADKVVYGGPCILVLGEKLLLASRL